MHRIGIDTRGLAPGFKAHFGRGTGRYGTELVRALIDVLPEDGDLAISLLGNDVLRARGWERKAIELLPFGRLTAETQLFLPRRFARSGCDGLHFLSHGDATARAGLPYVVTVLDLIPLRLPELYAADRPSWRFRLARALEQRAIAAASGVIAISEATKNDVVELIGVRPERVVVTPLAVSERFEPLERDDRAREETERRVRDRWQLPDDRPVVLYVGGIDPRKNVPFLVGAFADAAERTASANGGRAPRPLLVIAGDIKGDDQYPALERRMDHEAVRDDVRLVGFVDDDELLDLYRAAHLLAFPSLYEGFGLPVLEAMACGLPVIAGRNSCLPEIAGPAALLLPDRDRSAWSDAICRVLSDPVLARDLSEHGVRRRALFSWRRTAEETVAAYRRFLVGALRSGSRGAVAAVANPGRIH